MLLFSFFRIIIHFSVQFHGMNRSCNKGLKDGKE